MADSKLALNHPSQDPTSDRYLHPSLWCITQKDLDFFRKEVREYYDRGMIEKHRTFPDKYHDVKDIGPNMYQVNKFYIKPVTREAGGMSWAIMRHPDGCGPCDIFATHAWSEGVFEFCSKVFRVWPPNAKYLYTCFLANPQNADISAILSGPVENSPFAQALAVASHMIVLPNHAQSIYKRLWCVFEAHLAIDAIDTTERNLQITLPYIVPPSKLLNQILPGAFMPLFGFLVSRDFIADHVAIAFGPAMWLLMNFSACSISEFVIKRTLLRKLKLDVEVVAMWMVTFSYFELFVTGVSTDLAWWHIGDRDEFHNETWSAATANHHVQTLLSLKDLNIRFEPGEDKSCLLLACCLVSMFLSKIYQELIRNVLDLEAKEIEFESVAEADCSSKDDARRINEKICDNIDHIDSTITDLKKVGFYNRDVRMNLDKGMSHKSVSLGIRPFRIIAAVCAWEFWWITDLDGRDMNFQANLMFAMSCAIVLLLVYCVFGQKALFAIDAALYFGVAFAIISNHHSFFTEENAMNMTMTWSTLWLQIIFFIVMIAVDIFFYAGYWRETYDHLHRSPLTSSDEEDDEVEHVLLP